MRYPIDIDRAITERANYCEDKYCEALAAGRDQFANYWAKQEYAALYPDGRDADGWAGK